MRNRTLTALAAVGLVAATLTIAAPAQAAPDPVQDRTYKDGNYLVMLVDTPAGAYPGGIRGYARTRPAPGKKFDATSSAAVKYRAFLKAKHNRLLNRVGAESYYDYTVALNGFAAHLTSKQAETLAKTPGVLAVVPDAIRKPDTFNSPEFLGLRDQGSLWDQVGGQSNAGKGVIVGVLDTGIWPESKSFAGKFVKRNAAGQIIPGQGIRATWRGICQEGERWNAQDCNDKLIGARYYVAGFGKRDVDPSDFFSPRDADGHGSHTASTAAGNAVPDVNVDGKEFGDISGMAPAADIAAYKVCWTGHIKRGIPDGCSNSDSAAAVDQAVIDGVDVLNYSIGGTSEPGTFDAVDVAFLFAAEAGVFVATSAGNNGPNASTLGKWPTPWTTGAAASTHWIAEQKLVLGNGDEYIGSSTTGSLTTPTPMVAARASGAAGVPANNAALCLPGSLDPAKVSGKLLVCERGTNARIEKSFVARDAGAVGMVLVNPTPNSLNGDLHAIPTVHIGNEAYDPLYDYLDTANPVGSIVPLAPGESTTEVPEVAAFSSRGPSITTSGDILKPDISAPGVDVLAAVSPVGPTHYGRNYDLISGTSMASPHIAGLGALLYQKHNDWSPMMIKSALMTTAVDHASTGAEDGGVFAQGAGFVQPNPAGDPGIVFDSGLIDWLGYLETVVGDLDASFGTTIPTVDGSQLNQASIALGSLTGVETVVRTLTNVSDQTETYTPSADIDGISVEFDPATVTIPAGESRDVEITFTREDAAAGEYATGSLTWDGDNGHSARMPLAVRPVDIAAPAEVTGDGASGSVEIETTAGFSGTLGTEVHGLVGATPSAESVTVGPFDDANPVADADTDRFEVTATGAKAIRFDVDGAASADLDLWVYQVVDGEEELIDLSADGDADETVTLRDPEDGTYVAYVNGFAGDGNYQWTQWVVGDADAGNLVVTPDSQPVTVGETVTFDASWSGLDTTKRWFGVIGWTRDGAEEVGGTLVSIG
ncbi:S8 family peptidase [Nocardioides bizhenqiangii]|uniref:S8 family peptidase n=1 Tax=Nocardioides bizhenqiangii TaxID=3095076 RepID=A0ABZ0ZUH4_9ACTN|nr:S8 family peptidase [Nocardioides sp. HM61]WQQ27287.1 S8 family peptidase [Nocardioides sp. HM61]